MASLPTVGASSGTHGTVINEYLSVGHNADGTHTKAAMLTDMEWSPTAYVGGESVTFPNKLIFKHGVESVLANTGEDVTFGTAFPNDIISGSATIRRTTAGITNGAHCRASLDKITLVNDVTSTQYIYWQAWGY